MEYVEGQDLLVSELSKADSEYDLIVAPINLGVKTWKESQAYQLDSVLKLGNLYIVSQDENWNESGKTIAAFGEKAVPGMVFNSLYFFTRKPQLNTILRLWSFRSITLSKSR